ncbi:MAG: hypothetical protein AABW82_01585 [Nanoarchaeota archaeon]|mgnify:FL=1
MKSLRSLVALTGLTAALTGCVTKNEYTSADTSRLSKTARTALTTPSARPEYNLPAQPSFEEKQELAKQYNRLPSYSGNVHIFNGSGKLEVYAPLSTDSPLNSQYGTLRAIQNRIPAGAQTYSFNLAPSTEAARRQLSDAVFSGFQNYTTDPTRAGVKVTVNQEDSINHKKASDKFNVTLTFGEKNLTVNHKITDTRTPLKIGGAGGIGYLIAGIPGAVGVGGFEAVSSGIDYSQGGKLPPNTRVVEKTFNAGNLEEKVGATYDILAKARGDIIVFPHQYGTAVISVNNAKGLIVGPNAEVGLKPNQITFTTSREGANTCLMLLGHAAGAGAIRIGTALNENNDLNGILTSSGGRTSGPGGAPGSSGGRSGAPGGGP